MYNGRGYVRSSRLCTIVMVLFNRSRYVHTVIAVTYDVALMYDLYSYVRLSRLRMIVAVMYNCHGCVQSSPLCTIVAVTYDHRRYVQSSPLCTIVAVMYNRRRYVRSSRLCSMVAVVYDCRGYVRILCNRERESWESNPGPLRYRCSSLTTN